MKIVNHSPNTNKSNIGLVALITGLILLVPFIGIFVSDEMNWGYFDFVFMGLFIFIAGLIIDWVVRKFDNKYRVISLFLVVFGFFVVWLELSVGIFD